MPGLYTIVPSGSCHQIQALTVDVQSPRDNSVVSHFSPVHGEGFVSSRDASCDRRHAREVLWNGTMIQTLGPAVCYSRTSTAVYVEGKCSASRIGGVTAIHRIVTSFERVGVLINRHTTHFYHSCTLQKDSGPESPIY